MNKEEVVQLNKLKRKTGLFFIIVMGVMLICFIFLIQFEVNKEKISASYMKQNKNVIEAYELAPNGIIEKAYPLKGNEKVIGMNTLELPERQKEANIARKSGEYTIAGPYELKQGGTGALLFDPIYINDGNEKKFWGFSILVLNWDAFLEELEVDKLEDATYHFKVWKEGNNGKHVTIMSCGHSSLNHTLSVACEVPNDTWYFEIVPFQGWIPMSYKIFGSIVSVLVAILLSMGYWQIILRREKEAVYAKQIEKVATEAQHANQAKTRFLFNMSHDIRTPMNAILGYNQLLKENLTDPKLLDYQKKIEQSGKLLLSIINNVLDMARIESGKMEIDENVDRMGDILEEICGVFESVAKEKNIEIKSEICVTHKNVLCDGTKVREIVINLVSNALKYTPDGGIVTIKVQELPGDKEGYVKIKTEVADTGIGMSKDYIPTIFDSFSRERNTTIGKISGTGLGMSIVKRMVDMMGGTIEVNSELGKGSCFTVILQHRLADDRYYEKKSSPKQGVSKAVLKGKRILLAEDNDLNAEITTTILENEGMLVDRAADGVQCVDKIDRMPAGTYDLILMDIQMPNMDGYQATKLIRQFADKEKADIPIIAMTANAFEEDKRNALAAGMNGHMAKPIHVDKLLLTLVESIR